MQRQDLILRRHPDEVNEVMNEEVDEKNVVEFAEEEMDEVIENETVSTSSSQSDYQEQTWTKISN